MSVKLTQTASMLFFGMVVEYRGLISFSSYCLQCLFSRSAMLQDVAPLYFIAMTFKASSMNYNAVNYIPSSTVNARANPTYHAVIIGSYAFLKGVLLLSCNLTEILGFSTILMLGLFSIRAFRNLRDSSLDICPSYLSVLYHVFTFANRLFSCP